MSTVIRAVDLACHYAVSRGAFRKPASVKALDGATFSVESGQTLAVVGESGCGKSTLARLLTMIEPASSGELTIDGVDVATGGAAEDPVINPGDKLYVPQAQTFYVYGQIAAPGVYRLEADMSLRKAIARGGGLTPSGSEKRVKVFRDGKEIKRYDLNATIQPGDVVVVGERFF